MAINETNFVDSGELRTAVEILQNAEAVNDFEGNPQLEVIGDAWVKWVPLTGTKGQLLMQQFARVTSSVVMRWRAGIHPGMWIRRKSDGRLAAIQGVLPVAGGYRYLELAVAEEVPYASTT